MEPWPINPVRPKKNALQYRLLRERLFWGLRMALAYFITFTTYGTWLHGTDKGMGSVDGEHNEYGAELVEPDPGREREAREAMVQPAYTMDAARREVVR